MGDESGAIERIGFLTRSEARVRILTHLLEVEEATQREFRDRLDHSRSTVTRSLSALVDRGCLDRDGDHYRLTPSGRIIADGLADLVDTVRTTDDLSVFLEWFPYAEYDLDIDQLRGAEVTASTKADPYAPTRKHADELASAARCRMLLPSIDRQLLDGMHDRVVAGDLDLEMLLSPGMEETVTTDAYASVLHEQIADGELEVFVCEEQAPFYLGLTDNVVQIGVEDDEGFPRALLETDRESVREWAEDVYAGYRTHARHKPAAEF